MQSPPDVMALSTSAEVDALLMRCKPYFDVVFGATLMINDASIKALLEGMPPELMPAFEAYAHSLISALFRYGQVGAALGLLAARDPDGLRAALAHDFEAEPAAEASSSYLH